MKKSKFNEAQIVAALRECVSGTTVGEVARKVGVSEQTLYTWKKSTPPSTWPTSAKFVSSRKRTPSSNGSSPTCRSTR